MLDSRNYSSPERADQPDQVRDGSAQSIDGAKLLQEGKNQNLFDRNGSASDHSLQSLGFPPASTIIDDSNGLLALNRPGRPLTQEELDKLNRPIIGPDGQPVRPLGR